MTCRMRAIALVTANSDDESNTHAVGSGRHCGRTIDAACAEQGDYRGKVEAAAIRVAKEF